MSHEGGISLHVAQIYSRNSENMTEKYPDVIQARFFAGNSDIASHQSPWNLMGVSLFTTNV